MAKWETKADRVVLFQTTATQDGLIEHMDPEQRQKVDLLVTEYRAYKDPKGVLREYYLKIAPSLAKFDRTHRLLVATIALLEGWSGVKGNAADVLAKTGPLLVGADEAEDLERLQKFQPLFVEFFGVAGLPAELKSDAIQKQVKEHLQARAEIPPAPPKQTLSELRADQRGLHVLADECFQIFHDFLDGYFGKTGDAAFKKKQKYGYDRRYGRYHSAPKQTPAPDPAPAPAQGKSTPEEEESESGEEQQAPASAKTVSQKSNPVATGAGTKTTSAPGTTAGTGKPGTTKSNNP